MIRALLALELRRQRPILLRMALLTILVGIVFFVAGKRAPESLLATLIGCSLGVVLIVPMGISRDKMEGTLEFICGLPVEPHEIAASRFIGVALLVIPWAVGIGVLSLRVPAMDALNPIGVAVLAWLAMLLLGACATALFTCFDLESLLGAPFVGMVIAIVLVPRVVHAFIPGITQENVLQFLRWPAAPVVLAVALLVAVGVIGVAAFAVTVRGFERHHPALRLR